QDPPPGALAPELARGEVALGAGEMPLPGALAPFGPLVESSGFEQAGSSATPATSPAASTRLIQRSLR
ncbi:hypothetical protein MJ435_02260, partial [Burkholderia gladioli]